MKLWNLISSWLDITCQITTKCATVSKPKLFHQLNTPFVVESWTFLSPSVSYHPRAKCPFGFFHTLERFLKDKTFETLKWNTFALPQRHWFGHVKCKHWSFTYEAVGIQASLVSTQMGDYLNHLLMETYQVQTKLSIVKIQLWRILGYFLPNGDRIK